MRTKKPQKDALGRKKPERKVSKKRINTAAKGARNERRCLKQLESEGYHATRSAASIGVWDVVAIGSTNVRVVQVKTNFRPTREEMRKMESCVYAHNVRKELWTYYDRCSTPRIEEVKTVSDNHTVCTGCGAHNPR